MTPRCKQEDAFSHCDNDRQLHIHTNSIPLIYGANNRFSGSVRDISRTWLTRKLLPKFILSRGSFIIIRVMLPYWQGVGAWWCFVCLSFLKLQSDLTRAHNHPFWVTIIGWVCSSVGLLGWLSTASAVTHPGGCNLILRITYMHNRIHAERQSPH